MYDTALGRHTDEEETDDVPSSPKRRPTGNGLPNQSDEEFSRDDDNTTWGPWYMPLDQQNLNLREYRKTGFHSLFGQFSVGDEVVIDKVRSYHKLSIFFDSV